MKLNEKALKDIKTWEKAGFNLPKFNRMLVKENTMANPNWIRLVRATFSEHLLLICNRIF